MNTPEEKMSVLLCEDDENLGMLLREYLQAKGYDTELCPDGEAGYRAFTQNKYDLCVLDVMMPKKDGFSLARDIRQINEEIPIIFLTAKTLKEDILEGFRIGRYRRLKLMRHVVNEVILYLRQPLLTEDCPNCKDKDYQQQQSEDYSRDHKLDT